MRQLLERYRLEITAGKLRRASKGKRIDCFLRQEWSSKTLSQTRAAEFGCYRDERLKIVKPGTVIRDLELLRTIFEIARTEWGIPLTENPLAKVRKPKAYGGW